MSEQPMPMQSQLWELVRSALPAARQAVREYIASDGYLPRLDAREYRENEHGWPLVTSSSLSGTGTVDRAGLLSTHRGQLSYVYFGDVPELAAATEAALELAESDPDLGRGISMFMHVVEDERRYERIRRDFVLMIGQIIARAEALGIEDEAGLYGLYMQVERARFSPQLTGDVMIPLVLTAFDVDEPVQLGPDLWLEPLDEGTQRARALDRMHSDTVSPLIAAAATHAVVLRHITFNNIAWPPRLLRGHEVPPVALAAFDQVVECIYIVTGEKSGYAQVLVRPHGWVADDWHGDLPTVWSAMQVKAYPDDFDGGWLRAKKSIDTEQVDQIVAAIAGLRNSPRNVLLAARRCLRSAFRSNVEDEIIDATIGIEALLGKDRDELTHRMSQRAAVVLAGDYAPKDVYSLLKQVYSQRSSIVHGMVPKNSTVSLGDKHFAANEIAVLLLRLLLRNYLVAREPWTPDSLDAAILSRLSPVDSAQNLRRS